MTMTRATCVRGAAPALLALVAIALTFVSSTIILLLAGANPLEAFGHLLTGAFESTRKLGDVAVAAVPLLLCSAGMLVTFAAGLWNIGVEGQMVAGAVTATWATLAVPAPDRPMHLLPLFLLAAAPQLAARDSTDFVVWNHGRRAGEMQLVVTGDSVAVRYLHIDRQRGPKVEGYYRLSGGRRLCGRSRHEPEDCVDQLGIGAQPCDRVRIELRHAHDSEQLLAGHRRRRLERVGCDLLD